MSQWPVDPDTGLCAECLYEERYKSGVAAVRAEIASKLSRKSNILSVGYKLAQLILLVASSPAAEHDIVKLIDKLAETTHNGGDGEQ